MTTYRGSDGELKKDDQTVACVTSFSVENAPNIDPVYEMGSRDVQEFHKGNNEITGSFDKVYADTSYVDDINSDTMSTYTFEGIVSTSVGGTITITLSEVTLTSWSWDLPADDWVTESVDFQAKSLHTSTS